MSPSQASHTLLHIKFLVEFGEIETANSKMDRRSIEPRSRSHFLQKSRISSAIRGLAPHIRQSTAAVQAAGSVLLTGSAVHTATGV